MKLTPKIKESCREIEDVYFDVTLIVDKSNIILVVDNQKEDWHDYVDTNTLAVKQVKIEI